MSTDDSKQLIQKLYIAYYGRPADQIGLDFWMDKLERASGDRSQVISEFGQSDEFSSRFGGLEDETLINNIYQFLYGRNAEQAGMAFYRARLQSGDASLIDIVAQILDGTQESDEAIVANKLEVADYITAKVDSEDVSYRDNEIADAKTILFGVNASQGSVIAAKSSADTIIPTFPLFTFDRTVNLTAGPDTITAEDTNDFIVGTDQTLSSGDSIDGGGGRDMLWVELDSLEEDPFTAINVETIAIQNRAAGQTISLKTATDGVGTVLNHNGTKDLTLTNVQNVTAVKLFNGGGADSDFTIQFEDPLLVTEDNAVDILLREANAGVVTVGDSLGGGVESLNVSLIGIGLFNTLQGLVSADAKTLNIDGRGNLTIINSLQGFEMIDGSAVDGSLAISASAGSVTGGAGNDKFILTPGKNKLIAELGAGNDDSTITLESNGTGEPSIINHGDGFDTSTLIQKAASVATVKFGFGDDQLVLQTEGDASSFADLGPGNDTAWLSESTDANATITVELNSGDDQMDAIHVDLARSNISINGGAGSDALEVHRDQISNVGANDTARVSGFEKLVVNSLNGDLDIGRFKSMGVSRLAVLRGADAMLLPRESVWADTPEAQQQDVDAAGEWFFQRESGSLDGRLAYYSESDGGVNTIQLTGMASENPSATAGVSGGDLVVNF